MISKINFILVLVGPVYTNTEEDFHMRSSVTFQFTCLANLLSNKTPKSYMVSNASTCV